MTDVFRPEMPDGVWLVELAPVSDPAEVVRAVFAALGIREHAVLPRDRVPEVDRADPVDRLAAVPAGKHLLLVVDDCEHLITAVAGLADRVLGVASTRTAVVLPAPFGPSRPSTVPVPTARLTPARAVVAPKRLTRPSAQMACVMRPRCRRG